MKHPLHIALATLVITVLTSHVSLAQKTGGATSPEEEGAALPSTSSSVPAAGPPPNVYSKFDPYVPKGTVQPIPTPADSLVLDTGGVRTALADLGIGFSGFSLNNLTYNFLQNTRNYVGPQVYNGQKFTVNLSNHNLALTYDLGQVGLPGGQFLVVGNASFQGLQSVNGPDNARVANLLYFQPLFNDKIELQIGYGVNSTAFIGTNVGGNIAGGILGPQSIIPFEVGLSFAQYGAPLANIKVNWNQAVYTRTSIQRSLSPGGLAAEVRSNPSGLRFTVPNAKPLFIHEAGYEVNAAPGQRFVWVRAGGIYNETKYRSFGNDPARPNSAGYALVDLQVSQPDQTLPFRGAYVGASVNYAPPGTNLYSRYLEGRLYYIGPFKDHPFDLLSFVATYNGFSKSGRRALTPPGQSSFENTQTYIGSYAYRVIPGLYVQPGLGVVVHPSFAPRFPVAFEGYLGLTSLF